MIRILGIDVGLSGGAALLEVQMDAQRVNDIIDLPTFGEGPSRRINAASLATWIRAAKPDHAFIELAGSMPQQGIASAFRYGRATGSLESTVACCGVPYTLVTPQVWKKHFGLKGPDKEQSRALAIKLYPGAAHFMVRKGDHGKSEALLIATYGAQRRAAR